MHRLGNKHGKSFEAWTDMHKLNNAVLCVETASLETEPRRDNRHGLSNSSTKLWCNRWFTIEYLKGIRWSPDTHVNSEGVPKAILKGVKSGCNNMGADTEDGLHV